MIFMNEGKIVIVEGTSCVGKTTLCEELKKLGWIVLPEAIRYLEQETGKSGDEASPIPGSQEEEEYYQDQLFRIEKQKILEANKLKKQGKKVIIDKSAIATVATAKAFEEPKGFNGTFKRAYMKYCEMLQELKNEGFQQGIQQGIQQGKKQGMQTFADLTKKLLALHRTNDLNRAIEDEQYRDQLMKELAIQ